MRSFILVFVSGCLLLVIGVFASLHGSLDPTAIFTGVIALFTIGLFAIGGDASTRQLRAYVGITPDPDYPPPTLDELHTKGFRFHVINYGKTPAHNVIHEIAIGGWIEEPVFEENKRPIQGSKFVLHPGAHSEMKIA